MDRPQVTATGSVTSVIGGLVFVVAMVVAVPVGVMLVGALWSAAFGWLSSEPQPTSEGEPG